MGVCIQYQDFDVGSELARMRYGRQDIGAIVNFIGLVRDSNTHSVVSAMELTYYPGMTEKSLQVIEEEARQKWNLIDVQIIHRVGLLRPCDQIVLVMVASPHRGEAFSAGEFIMDNLKTRAPFWKREQTPEGFRWVDAKIDDDQMTARWGEIKS